jgi:hypothetical protein
MLFSLIDVAIDVGIEGDQSGPSLACPFPRALARGVGQAIGSGCGPPARGDC